MRLIRKYWLDTRWFLLFGLVFQIGIAAFVVFGKDYDAAKWLAALERNEMRWGGSGSASFVSLATYRGYLWANWFQSLMLVMWPAWAMAFGSLLVFGDKAFGISGLLPRFLLSLPISRRRIVAEAVSFGTAQLLLLALIPSASLCLFAAVAGQHFSLADALIFTGLIVGNGFVFFALSYLLAFLFKRSWIAVVLILGVYFALWPFQHFSLPEPPWWSAFYARMSGLTYLASGTIPWVQTILSLLVALGALTGALYVFERRDF